MMRGSSARLNCAVALAVAFGASVGSGSEPERQISFGADILPMLTKAGCNAGACHGAATGQGGFKLSLLGYDTRGDYESITRDLSGRRIHLAEPEKSLLLRKPTKQLRHKGGRRIDDDSEEYETLVRWIGQGAPFGPADLYAQGISVEPKELLLDENEDVPRLRVWADYSDGSRREVTRWALFDSNDDAIADVRTDGGVLLRGKGQTSIMVRFSGLVAAAQVLAPVSELEVASADFPFQNDVDRAVFGALKKLGMPPSPLCEPSKFLRRVTLDLAGRLPTEAEVRAFLDKPDSPAVRRAEIDRLLAGADFVDYWTLRLADVLLIHSKQQGPEGARVYHTWLKKQVARNTPLDVMARQLVTGLGNYTENGPPNFYRLTTDPRDMGEYVSQNLLGMRLACARCHHHPFDRWSQEDYYSFAAFFARTTLDGQKIVLRDRGEVRHPKTDEVMLPAPPGSGQPVGADIDDRREALAEWMTDPGNPHFAKAMVNRVWAWMVGRGLVEPVDDLRATNPPSNPELLDTLADSFVKNGYDLRKLIRLIASSRTYQLSSSPNEINRADERLFSRGLLKPLSAQVLADALAQATGVKDVFPEDPGAERAVQLHDPAMASYTLDVFGRCPRTDNCGSGIEYGGGLTQALHLINGNHLNAKLRKADLHDWIAAGRNDDAILETLYVRTLGRLPGNTESSHWLARARSAASRDVFFQDLLWALCNSREFAFNH